MGIKRSFWSLLIHQKKLGKAEYFRLIRTARNFVIVMLSLSIAVILGIAVFSEGGIVDVIGTIAGVSPLLYAAAIGSVFLGYVLNFFKWRYYLKVLRIRLPLRKNFAIFMSLYAMELTPGRIGRVVSAYTIKRVSKKKFMAVLPIVSIDIFTEYLGFMALSMIIGIMYPSYLLFVLPVAVLLSLPFLFIVSPWLFNLLKKKVLYGRFAELLSFYGEEYFAAQSKISSKKMYGISMLFTLPAAVLNGLALYLVLLGLGVKAAVTDSLLVYVVSTLIGYISFIPGAIGSTDLSMLALISSSFGTDGTVSAAATILTRVATLWFAVIVGTIFLFYTFKYWSDRRAPAQKADPRSRKAANRR